MAKAMNILVIDDDDVTAEVIERALRKSGCDFNIVAAGDGQDGLRSLRGQSERSVALPRLILLDLNMPRMNGFEFLEAVREDDELKSSVIFVLTTSDSDADRARAYNEQVAGYMVKSAVGPQFVHLSTLLNDYACAVSLPE